MSVVDSHTDNVRANVTAAGRQVEAARHELTICTRHTMVGPSLRNSIDAMTEALRVASVNLDNAVRALDAHTKEV